MLHLAFWNGDGSIKNRLDDVLVAVPTRQRSVVSEETVGIIRKKIRQWNREVQDVAVDWARIDDIFELFEMSERKVVSICQLKHILKKSDVDN